MTRLYIDIETYCDLDLKKTNAYVYAAHESFTILMMAAAGGTGPVSVLEDEQSILGFIRDALARPDITLVAHNAAFERICFSAKLLPPHQYLPPERWDDTQARAGIWGHPQKLEKLAPAVGAQAKDAAGTRLINLFSKPYRGRRLGPEDRPEDWHAFVEYCRQDVESLRDIDQRLRAWPTREEKQMWLEDQRINDRGIRLDVELATAAQRAAENNAMDQEGELSRILGIDNAASVQQLQKGLTDIGLELENLRAETVKEALGREDLTDTQRTALGLRQELALAASKKFAAGLANVSEDGRMRGAFRYFGAHTGRWAGRGLQPQNLPRAQLDSEAATEAAVLDLKLGAGADAFTLKALVRAVFLGPFTVVDYSAIEARVVAWLAGEQWALDAFAAGRDIYVETADRMGLFPAGVDPYQLEKHDPVFDAGRFKGKVAVLALGYNGAVNSLRNMGGDGTDEELAALVRQWRQANSNIVRFWYDLESAFERGGRAGPHLRVERAGKSRYIWLPSGRAIAYHNVTRRTVIKKDKDGNPLPARNSLTYADPQRRFPYIDTYGGKLTENVTQAVARDLLAHGLLNLAEAGVTVVGHVHDEVICEGTLPVDLVSELVCNTPAWASGLPVTGAGDQFRRYRK